MQNIDGNLLRDNDAKLRIAVYDSKDEFRFSSPFGAPRTRKDNKGKIIHYTHTGVDLAAKEGAKVYAIADGKVVYVKYDKDGYGHYVVLEHFDKAGKSLGYSLYAHLKDPNDSSNHEALKNVKRFKIGDPVKIEETIGLVENKAKGGHSTGAHLHLEVRIPDKTKANNCTWHYDAKTGVKKGNECKWHDATPTNPVDFTGFSTATTSPTSPTPPVKPAEPVNGKNKNNNNKPHSELEGDYSDQPHDAVANNNESVGADSGALNGESTGTVEKGSVPAAVKTPRPAPPDAPHMRARQSRSDEIWYNMEYKHLFPAFGINPLRDRRSAADDREWYNMEYKHLFAAFGIDDGAQDVDLANGTLEQCSSAFLRSRGERDGEWLNPEYKHLYAAFGIDDGKGGHITRKKIKIVIHIDKDGNQTVESVSDPNTTVNLRKPDEMDFLGGGFKDR